MGEIVVTESVLPHACEAGGLMETGVDQAIGEERRLPSEDAAVEERGENRDVELVAAGEDQRRLGAEVASDTPLEQRMNRVGTREQARARRPDSPAVGAAP